MAMQDDILRGRVSSLDPREMLKRMSDMKKLPSGCKVPPVPALMIKGKTVPPGEQQDIGPSKLITKKPLSEQLAI